MKFSQMPYSRVELEGIKAGYEDLIERSRHAENGEEQYEIHREYYRFFNHNQTNFKIAMIRHDSDVTDEFYKGEQDYYDQIQPVIDNLENAYRRVLYESPYRAYLEDKIGKITFRNMELAMRSSDDRIVTLKQEENMLNRRYGNLIATARIPFEGEVYNLSLMKKFQTSQDRETRRKAWKAVSEYFQLVTGELDEIYDLLVKNRDRQAKALGHDNFIELGYDRRKRNCFRAAEVKQFREHVKKYLVPFVQELQEKRRKRLGVDKLSFIDSDMYFAQGNPAPCGTPEEILRKGQQMYGELSGETREFFDFMMENELFEVLGRKTKRQGGYMTYIPDYKAPFVFANFNGTNGDIDVITHECGHAFQGYLTRNEEVREYTQLTWECGETHSMSMEYFTYPWMGLFFGDRKEDYITAHMEDSIAFIPYGCMVDEFQHRIYEEPDMTPAKRKQLWMELEGEYRPYMDYEDDPFYSNGGIWQRQMHIFRLPFYYIDYCLASVCAMQFKAMMDQDYQKAWKVYCQFCRLSARKSFVEILEETGLENPFEEACIRKLTGVLRDITSTH